MKHFVRRGAVLCATARVVYQWFRWWKRSELPSLRSRRVLIRMIEEKECRNLDTIVGPGLRAKVLDKARRRRMAIWKAKANPQPDPLRVLRSALAKMEQMDQEGTLTPEQRWLKEEIRRAL